MKAIVFVDVFSVECRVVSEGKNYALFELMAKPNNAKWYFKNPDSGDNEPADKYKPLLKALENVDYYKL